MLERLSGLSVYNAGIGRYGPVEYQIVLEETLRLLPRIVVVGFYPANDVWEAFRTVYVDERSPPFAPLRPGSEREFLEKREERGPRFARLRHHDSEQLAAIWAKADFTVLRAMAADRLGEDVLPSAAPADDRSALRLWLSAHSSTYGLLRESWHVLSALWRAAKGDPAPKAYAESFEESAKRPKRLAWDRDPRFRTVFHNPVYDLLAVDVGELRVREGTRVTRQIFREIRDRLAAEHIGLVVALIPSK